jgi:galactose mutarotase-like enzyme
MRDGFVRRASGCRGRVVQWEGHRVVEMDSRHLLVRVSVSRGGEILELRDKRTDLDVLWHGHDDIVRNRRGVVSVAHPDGNFLDHFAGGWQEILPAAQFPDSYRGAAFGVHGEAALLPWDWSIVVDEPDELAVELTVRLRRFPVTLTRRMSISSEAAVLRFDERLSNNSGERLPVMWGHHLCLNGQLAHPGARMWLPDSTPLLVPDSDSSTTALRPGPGWWPQMTAPDGGSVDLTVLPRSDGSEAILIAGPVPAGKAYVDSPDWDLAVELDWDEAVFPYCWSWMVWEGHHTWPLWGTQRLLTIEPFTSPLVPLNEALRTGRALDLGPNATVETTLSVTLRPSNSMRQRREAGR